ncbi:hypothetical protein BJ508DRAFT_374945 [Ascobolus immersus RN42]|uniref:BTB domain-containing protein n=1 Tax=Ascobolus immersus RN42 TaxID=1160509 RepID=A0A3N4IC89_ASCIM|nr:hypothetical protein BJ508DRAFT_374945 [Ascobolus immersus RN42]
MGRASEVVSSPTIEVWIVKPPVSKADTGFASPQHNPSSSPSSASAEPPTKKRKVASNDAAEEDEREVIACYNLHISALTENSDYFKALMSFNGVEVAENRIVLELPELDCPFRVGKDSELGRKYELDDDLELDGWQYSIIAFKCFVDFAYSGSYNAADHADSLLGEEERRWNYSAHYPDKYFLVNAAVYVLAERLLAKDLQESVLQTTYDFFNAIALRGSGEADCMSKDEFWLRMPDWFEGMNMDLFGAQEQSLWLNGIKWVLDGTTDKAPTTKDSEGETGEEKESESEGEEEESEKDEDEAAKYRLHKALKDQEKRELLMGKEPMRRLIAAFAVCCWWDEASAEVLEHCPGLQTLLQGYEKEFSERFKRVPSLDSFYLYIHT